MVILIPIKYDPAHFSRCRISSTILFQTENTTGEYVGDLGSLESTDGRVVFRKEKSAIKLSGPEDRNVLNRALVIHADPTGGDRVMCCTIRAF